MIFNLGSFDMDAHVVIKFFIKCGYTIRQMLEHLKCGFDDATLGKIAVFN